MNSLIHLLANIVLEILPHLGRRVGRVSREERLQKLEERVAFLEKQDDLHRAHLAMLMFRLLALEKRYKRSDRINARAVSERELSN